MATYERSANCKRFTEVDKDLGIVKVVDFPNSEFRIHNFSAPLRLRG